MQYITRSIPFLFMVLTFFSLIQLVQPVPLENNSQDMKHLIKRNNNNNKDAAPARPKTLKYATERNCSGDFTCGFHCLFKESYLFGKCNKISKKCICTTPLFHKDIQEDPRIIVVPAPH
ncbi:hypothetical protein BDA99DRAFT_14401 [Phascolomyces articulosus]|uniref:Uncharacterized protein n=1 Tax=Phascolomyces articulosus TaxID=60185 RepID=A0AAD5KS01_9FUNG|nr:hypothetical protein BDA99DRAFT_14401 [Phascolomyces articulosus]